MRPVIAQKKTNCYFCKEIIPAGSQRLTDTVTKELKGERRYFTRHFHFQKDDQTGSCLELWAKKVFERLPIGIRTNNPRGRPQLDLSDDAKIRRTKLLKSLRNQFRYYVRQGNMDLTPKYPNEMDVGDVRKAKKFQSNLDHIFSELTKVGGIPDRYKDYASHVVQ